MTLVNKLLPRPSSSFITTRLSLFLSVLSMPGWLVFIPLFWSASVYAIDPDSTLPIQIESDSATLDDAKGTSTYTGNVIISQGDSRLEADQIIVKAKDRKLVSISAIGAPAHFVQALKETSETEAQKETHGYANEIVYLAAEGMLKLLNHAKLIQGNNSFKGELIEYDIAKKAIKAKGDEEKGSRVKIEYFPASSDELSVKESTNKAPSTPETKPTE